MHPTSFVFYTVLTLALPGCASLDRADYQPPKYIYEAWAKPGAPVDAVKQAMQSCGYKNLALGNDLSKEEIAHSEACMSRQGFRLDLNSYRPGNCYGPNSPYLCNRLWGGEKPKPQPVRKYD